MLEIKDMTINDTSAVAHVEKESFPSPWSEELFKDEMINPLARYILLLKDGQVIGYAGFWLIIGEAQITNIAILPENRGKGLGKMLIESLLAKAESEKADTIYLEVRKSNITALQLYQKFGFNMVGERKGYYQDNGEDAFLMRKELKKENE